MSGSKARDWPWALQPLWAASWGLRCQRARPLHSEAKGPRVTPWAGAAARSPELRATSLLRCRSTASPGLALGQRPPHAGSELDAQTAGLLKPASSRDADWQEMGRDLPAGIGARALRTSWAGGTPTRQTAGGRGAAGLDARGQGLRPSGSFALPRGVRPSPPGLSRTWVLIRVNRF